MSYSSYFFIYVAYVNETESGKTISGSWHYGTRNYLTQTVIETVQLWMTCSGITPWVFNCLCTSWTINHHLIFCNALWRKKHLANTVITLNDTTLGQIIGSSVGELVQEWCADYVRTWFACRVLFTEKLCIQKRFNSIAIKHTVILIKCKARPTYACLKSMNFTFCCENDKMLELLLTSYQPSNVQFVDCILVNERFTVYCKSKAITLQWKYIVSRTHSVNIQPNIYMFKRNNNLMDCSASQTVLSDKFLQPCVEGLTDVQP